MADGIIGGIGTGKSFTEPRYGNVAGLFLKNTPGLNETSGQSMKDFANASFPPETIGLMKTALIDPERTILNVLCRKMCFAEKRRLRLVAFCYAYACTFGVAKEAGGISPSSQSCSSARARHADSILLNRRYEGWLGAISAKDAQRSAFSRKVRDAVILKLLSKPF